MISLLNCLLSRERVVNCGGDGVPAKFKHGDHLCIIIYSGYVMGGEPIVVLQWLCQHFVVI